MFFCYWNEQTDFNNVSNLATTFEDNFNCDFVCRISKNKRRSFGNSEIDFYLKLFHFEMEVWTYFQRDILEPKLNIFLLNLNRNCEVWSKSTSISNYFRDMNFFAWKKPMAYICALLIFFTTEHVSLTKSNLKKQIVNTRNLRIATIWNFLSRQFRFYWSKAFFIAESATLARSFMKKTVFKAKSCINGHVSLSQCVVWIRKICWRCSL